LRKTSAYARKIARNGSSYNGAEWLNTISSCRAFNDSSEPLPGAIVKETPDAAAYRALIQVKSAFESLKNGGTEYDYDVLAHATGVSTLRAIDIAGEANNPMIEIINIANAALSRAKERYQKMGKWGLDGLGIHEIADAIDVYEEILMNSSPAQMTRAVRIRNEILLKQMSNSQPVR